MIPTVDEMERARMQTPLPPKAGKPAKDKKRKPRVLPRLKRTPKQN